MQGQMSETDKTRVLRELKTIFAEASVQLAREIGQGTPSRAPEKKRRFPEERREAPTHRKPRENNLSVDVPRRATGQVDAHPSTFAYASGPSPYDPGSDNQEHHSTVNSIGSAFEDSRRQTRILRMRQESSRDEPSPSPQLSCGSPMPMNRLGCVGSEPDDSSERAVSSPPPLTKIVSAEHPSSSCSRSPISPAFAGGYGSPPPMRVFFPQTEGYGSQQELGYSQYQGVARSPVSPMAQAPLLGPGAYGGGGYGQPAAPPQFQYLVRNTPEPPQAAAAAPAPAPAPAAPPQVRHSYLATGDKPIGYNPDAPHQPRRIKTGEKLVQAVRIMPQEVKEQMKAAILGEVVDRRSHRVPRPDIPSLPPSQSLSNFISHHHARLPEGISTRGQQIHLWQFLFELLTAGDTYAGSISWTKKRRGEFKLLKPDDVAHLWGVRKNKEGMNYDKMSRAMRYYYEKGVMEKVHGQRYVYCFKDNVLESMAFFKPGHMTPSPRREQERISWGDIRIRKSSMNGSEVGMGHGGPLERHDDDFYSPASSDTPYECPSEDDRYREEEHSGAYSSRSFDPPRTPNSPGRHSVGRVRSRHERHSFQHPYAEQGEPRPMKSPSMAMVSHQAAVSPALLAPTPLGPRVVAAYPTHASPAYHSLPPGTKIFYASGMMSTTPSAHVMPPSIEAALSPVYPGCPIVLTGHGQPPAFQSVHLHPQ